MTGMQLIIPILDEEDTSQLGDMTRNEAHSGTAQNEINGEHNSHHDRVLPQELRESFEAMKSLWRQSSRNSEEEVSSTEERKRKEREQAIETALAIESEVLKWQNGIAELEAMLAAAENMEGSEDDYSEYEEDGSAQDEDRPMPVVRFPLLPPVVVPDEDDLTLQRSGSQTDLSDAADMETISG